MYNIYSCIDLTCDRCGLGTGQEPEEIDLSKDNVNERIAEVISIYEWDIRKTADGKEQHICADCIFNEEEVNS